MSTRTVVADALHDSTPAPPRSRARWFAEHCPFLVALALGAGLRLLVCVAFFPGLMIGDGPTYLSFLDTFRPDTNRPTGYGLLLLYPVSLVSDTVLAVVVVQHLLGLTTAVLLYALLRRWGVGRWAATLGTLPVLLDSMQLVLEHTPLSDTLFVLLVTLTVTVLSWRRRPTPAVALAAGLLLGASVTVRQVGMPLVLVAAAFCLMVGHGSRRRRVVTAAVLVLGFLGPVGAYAAWYQDEHGAYAISEIGGRSAYMRTTTFVDCSRISIPDYQRVLCPAEPLGERRDPTEYGWHDDRTLPRLDPPPGTTDDEAMLAFARAAMREHPGDYATVVLRDFALNFDLWRGNRFEFETARKWLFTSYVDLEPTGWTGPAFENHGGDQLTTRQPFANVLVAYQAVGYLPGPVLLGCLALGLAGGLGVGRARTSGMRSICLLLTVSGTALLLIPDVTTQFVWRYQLPALVLLPGAAALAVTALRGGQVPAGTRATPNTDWPNGGVTRRSAARVSGTSTRS